MSRYTLNEGSSDFMQNDGSALVNSETQIDKGTAKMGGNVAAGGPLDSVNVVTVHDTNDGRNVAGVNNAIGPANWTQSITGATLGNAASPWLGSIMISGDTTHGLVQNDVVRVRGASTGSNSGVYRVTSVTSANNYVLNGAYTATETDVDIDHATALTGAGGAKKRVGYLAAGRYAIRREDLSIYNGTASVDTMSSPASEYGRRKVHSRTAVRSHLVENAIRAGYWNPYTATWSTAITGQNDFSDFGADSEVQNSPSGWGLLGEYAYRYGVTTTTGNYPPDQNAG